MISLPKPKFADTNVPIGISKDDYRNKIIDMQAHVLEDAIDRVSIREFIKSTKPFHFLLTESRSFNEVVQVVEPYVKRDKMPISTSLFKTGNPVMKKRSSNFRFYPSADFFRPGNVSFQLKIV